MACTNHPLVTIGVAPCTLCSRSFCDGCLVEMNGQTVCASCKASAMAAEGTPATREATVPAGDVPPWERAAELGWWTAYWRTVKQVTTGPSAFFAGMEKEKASWTWLGIPAINYTLGTITSSMVYVLSFGPLVRWAATENPDLGAALEPLVGSIYFMAISGVVMAPVLGPVYAIVWAGCIHLWLWVFKKSRLPFAQTARGVCYADAPYALTLVPILGHIAALFVVPWANIRMVQRMHGTGFFTAFMSVFWVLILFCGCCVVPYVGLVGVAITQGGR